MDDSEEILQFLVDLGLSEIERPEVGQYRLHSVIGKGQKGVLCRYVNDHADEVAVKFLIVPSDQRALNLFENEAKALAAASAEMEKIPGLGGSNVPRAYSDVIKHPKYPIYYFFLEYIHGTTLRELVSLNTPSWDPWTSIDCIGRLACALVKFHALGWIHMDLNFGNIMIQPESEYKTEYKEKKTISSPAVKILDLGNAINYFERLPELWEIHGRKHEFPFKPVGDTNLSALELFLDPKQATPMADAFTVGTIFYYLLTSHYPYRARSFGELMEKKRRGVFEPVITESKPLNDFLLTFFKRVLSPNPDHRFNVNQIRRMMEDIKFRFVHKRNNDFLKLYFTHGGEIFSCIKCGTNMRPNLTHFGQQCPHCYYTIRVDDNWDNWY